SPNTIIYSDCWKSYDRIRLLDKNYQHFTVNHDIFFVDPKTGVHTNGIESILCSAKSLFKKMRGVSRPYLQPYLDEYTWRYNQNLLRTGAFGAILRLISKFNESALINEELNFIVHSLKSIQVEPVEEELEYEDETEPLTDNEIYLPDGDIHELNFPHNNLYENNIIYNLDKVDYEVKSLSQVDDEEFLNAVKLIISKILEKKIESYRFQSDLSNSQRKIIHDLSVKSNLTHVITGTRYRVLTISNQWVII
ncbi:unnamed protein product, partial [Brachionus calyciflorus]